MDKKTISLIFLFFLFLYISLCFKKPPWHDEIFTHWCAKKDIIGIFEATKLDSSPPFYYILVHFWAKFFGYKIEIIRIFSASLILISGLFFLKTLELIKIKAQQSLLLIFFYLHPLNFYYGIEARNYSLLIFLFSALIFYFLVKKNFFIFTLIFLLILYTHNLSILCISFLILFFIIFKEKKILISFLILIIFYLPLFLITSGQPKESIEWMNKKIMPNETIKFLGVLFPFAPQEMTYKFFDPKFFILLSGILNLIIIIFHIFKGNKLLRFFSFSILLYFFEIFIISIAIFRIYFPGRAEVLVLPFFLPLFFNFLNLFKEKLKNSILILIIFFFSIQNILFINSLKKYSIYEELAKKIKKYTYKGDILIIPNLWYLTIDYYLKKENHYLKIILIPEDQEKHPGWYKCESLSNYDKFKLKKIFKENKNIFIFFKKDSKCSLEILKISPEIKYLFSFKDFFFCKFEKK